MQNHRQRKHGLERFLHPARSIKIDDDQYQRHHRLHDQRRMGRPILGVDFAEPRGHVRIQAGDERNARRAAHPSRANPRDRETQHDREWSDNPRHANSAGHMADRLHNALQYADVVLADRDQQRQRRSNIKQPGNHAAPRHRARQRFPRFADFVAHHRSQFKSDQAKANHAERIQNKPGIRRNPKISRRHRRPKARQDRKSQTDQNRRRDKRSNGAHIVEPLPDAKTNNVHHRQQQQQQHGCDHCEILVVGQRCVARPHRKHSNSDEIQHHRRNIQHIISPVTPPGEEAVSVAEHFLCPQVHAAFARIAMRKFDHRDPLWPEKQQQRNKPQPDGHAPVGGDAGDNIQIEYGDDKQQHQVKASEHAL